MSTWRPVREYARNYACCFFFRLRNTASHSQGRIKITGELLQKSTTTQVRRRTKGWTISFGNVSAWHLRLTQLFYWLLLEVTTTCFGPILGPSSGCITRLRVSYMLWEREREIVRETLCVSRNVRFVHSPYVEAGWNVMAHAQKPDFFFRRNGPVHLNRGGGGGGGGGGGVSSVDYWQPRCANQR